MKINKILCGMALGMASLSAHAVAVYWEPTDGNVNFTYTTVAGYSLGISMLMTLMARKQIH